MKTRDEDDFAGFARGQSGSLFRTAYLLTGDYQQGEDLLRLTLTKVYARWTRIDPMTQPDAYARRLLVDQATSWRRRRSYTELPARPPAGAEDPGYDERLAVSCAVWNAVLRLPPRQRAVLVLRYHEGLSEADTAEVLGIPPGTVRGLAQAAGERLAPLPAGPAAEEAVTRIDDLLRTSAGDVAGTVAPPGIDPAEVRGRARGRRAARRRRLLAGVGLAAAVVAAVLLVVPDHGDRPAAAPPTRLDAPRDAAVWGDARGIHVGARTYAPAARPTSLTLVADAVVYQDRRARLWLQPLDGAAPRRIGTSSPGSSPLGRADGTTVAWVEHLPGDGTGDHLVVYDTQRGEELARTGVTGDGAVAGTLTGGDRVQNWGPFLYVDRHQVVLHPALGTYLLDVASEKATRLTGEEPRPNAETVPGDLLVTVDAVPGLRVVAICCGTDRRLQRPLALVDDAGRMHDYLGLLEPSGLFDHDWRHFATVVDTTRLRHRVEVVDVDTGRVRALTPETRLYPLLGWGYGDVLMVQEFDGDIPGADPLRLLRCDISAWSCTRVHVAPMDVAPGRVLLPTS